MLGRVKNKAMQLLTFGTVGLLLTENALAADLLKGTMPGLKENFGMDSLPIKILMLIETLVIAYLFIITKDVRVFAGVIALYIFLNTSLGMYVFI